MTANLNKTVMITSLSSISGECIIASISAPELCVMEPFVRDVVWLF